MGFFSKANWLSGTHLDGGVLFGGFAAVTAGKSAASAAPLIAAW
jgi:hypothetical protein